MFPFQTIVVFVGPSCGFYKGSLQGGIRAQPPFLVVEKDKFQLQARPRYSQADHSKKHTGMDTHQESQGTPLWYARLTRDITGAERYASPCVCFEVL